jgi:hypothetical protein
MTRKIRIASALALMGASLTAAPAVALAGSPLLSGYGGPGAGEQAILGSTLLGGPHGGAGSGGSSGPGGSGGSGLGGSDGTTPASGSGPASSGTGLSRAGGSPARSSAPKSATRNASRGSSASRPHAAGANRTGAYVYPSLRRSASSDSSVIGMSSGNVLALVGIVAMLALIGVLTVRFARLQP